MWVLKGQIFQARPSRTHRAHVVELAYTAVFQTAALLRDCGFEPHRAHAWRCKLPLQDLLRGRLLLPRPIRYGNLHTGRPTKCRARSSRKTCRAHRQHPQDRVGWLAPVYLVPVRDGSRLRSSRCLLARSRVRRLHRRKIGRGGDVRRSALSRALALIASSLLVLGILVLGHATPLPA